MDFTILADIKKFTSLNEVFQKIGQPKFRLDNRLIYYMGNGFLLGFSDIKFKVENSTRIEYGEKGEYAFCIYYFQNISYLEKYFKFRNESYNFDFDLLETNFEITDDICVYDTFEKARKVLSSKSHLMYYSDGETRTLNEYKEFIFLNRFITFGKFDMFFFEDSRKSKLTGFKYILED